MSKTNVDLSKTHHIISELEKFYNIKFERRILRDTKKGGGLNDISYSLDKDGNINGISIYDAAIKDLSPLSSLNLQYLNLTRNGITDLTPLKNHHNLKYLYLGGNKITSLDAINGKKNLITLIIWNNKIMEFPVLFLPKLKSLYCQNCNVKNLSFLKNLKSLVDLTVTRNQINNIDFFDDFHKLTLLDLTGNLINNIPSRIAEKYNWLNKSVSTEDYVEEIGIRLLENPLYYPPQSVIELGAETVANYYKSAKLFGHEPLSEGRIIVVGDGSAGKSSLIERILTDTFQLGKSQTNGIQIEKLELDHQDGRKLKFHIWDFGGQEIQHAVHKFFFTSGCLYLLVLDNRKEEEPEYWLQQIESLGGGAPVLVIFNKQDDNIVEIADRKFLKEKYPNIISFYNISCKNGIGIDTLKIDINKNAVLLRTVDEQFPNNWFGIKTEIESLTSGSKHYLDYDKYDEICTRYQTNDSTTQKLLLKYFTTIGAITWFGDTFLNFLHVLSPTWITQGVYKIITSKKTDKLAGIINIDDFRELLEPVHNSDYTYNESHYGYILSMMRKFDLCYSPDDKTILIPSAFGKEPKVEYHDFRGVHIRTYILQFKEYLPVAIMHRFIAKKLPEAFENNYWYTGIVIKDTKTDALAMVHIDREAKRIYIRIKGEVPLGMWEHIRREFGEITDAYAKIEYDELISLNEKSDSNVSYNDLVSFLKFNKEVYFHPKLEQDFNVGYLLGFFQTGDQTINKIKTGKISIGHTQESLKRIPPFLINIVNNNSPTVNTNVSTNIGINFQIVNELSSSVKGDANYIIKELGKTNEELKQLLNKIIQFADDAKSATSGEELKEKGWIRSLKGLIKPLAAAAAQIKDVKEGGEAIVSIIHKLYDLASQFNIDELTHLIKDYV